MKTSRTSHILGVFATIVVSSASARTSYAEDHKTFTGAQGVNRVVRTPSTGFYKAHGAGRMSFSGIPLVQPSNGLQDKPSFYLGGTSGGGTQLDAGLQYEPYVINGILPGWSAFISSAGDFCRPSVLRAADNASVPWRGTNGAPAWIASGIDFQFNSDGTAQTTIGVIAAQYSVKVIAPNNGTFFYNTSAGANLATPEHPIAPWQGATAFSGTLDKADVKHVIAMTRNFGGAGNDGSQLTGQWSECQAWDANGAHNWTNAIVSQGATGYDAPSNGDPGAKDGRGSWKVDFPGLNITPQEARTDSQASHLATTGSLSRYNEATVAINLRLPLPKGKGKAKAHR